MLYAVKGNKQLQIEVDEKDAYLKLGYDIAEDKDGKLETVETSPSKTVSVKQLEALQKENATLKEQLETAGDSGQIEELKKENKALKDKLADANKKLKEATQQSG